MDSQDPPILQRDDSRVSTVSSAVDVPETPEAKLETTNESPNFDEMIKTTTAPVTSSPISEAELLHRSPSVTS